MENSQSEFADYLGVLNFLSRCLFQYDYSGGRIKTAERSDRPLIFFSENILHERRWSVFPLWETGLHQLIGSDGRDIDLTARIDRLYQESNVRFVYSAMIEHARKMWYEDFPAFSIAGKKIEMGSSFRELFGIRVHGSDSIEPYVGVSFFWPENERFVIYSDGDNLSFIAGERKEIENLIGESYEFCMKQFLSINASHLTIPELYTALAKFCDDHLAS